ncbi:MAG TPA: glycosyltransferase family 39 protein, partial [Pyrinomonadaceae bacterium]
SAEQDYNYFLGLFDLFWQKNQANYETLTFWSRVPAVALTLMLGVLVFVYARRLFGPRAAVFAVFLYTVEPTVLAHGRVVQTDIPSAFSYLLFSLVLYEYLLAPTLRRAGLVGAAVGLAVVTKFSMVVLGPVLVLVAVMLFLSASRWNLSRGQVAAQAAVIALACLLTVHAAYFFHNRTPEPYDFSLTEAGLPQSVDAALRPLMPYAHAALHRVFPSDFVSGIGWQLGHNKWGHPAGLLGEHRVLGWWYYFPVAFALKTTLPFLLLSLASVAWAAWMYFARGRESKYLALLVPLAFFTGLVMLSKINIGVRYFLPAYMFMFVAGGALLDWLLRNFRPRGAALALAAAALCWTGLEAARAFPDYMAYMNQLASERPRWYYLSDSNVEWGDDIREMALYLKARGEKRVGAALLGGQVLARYGIDGTGIFVPPGETPEETRYVAVGASFLNGSTVPGGFEGFPLDERTRVNYFDEYRRRTPEKVFGNSIYLYRMKE